jgi:membrane protein implicated in regulation of membrane protease activity
MPLSLRARKRLSLLLLVVWMPLFVVAAVTVMNWLDRPPLWLELGIYAVLGIVWALPFRRVFQGIGKDASNEDK